MRSWPGFRGSSPGRLLRSLHWLTVLLLLPAGVATSPARAEADPTRASLHVTALSVPIPSLPTEDVDVVEVSVPASPVAPAMAVWPTEGTVYFFNEAISPPTVIATVPTRSANITGVDFVSDGTWGAFATLGYLYIFNMTTAVGPTLTTPPIPLPGTPARRDIDPILIPHPLSPSGVAVVYATGTEIRCFAIPSGLPLWGPIPLPTPVVEAVDPQVNAAGTLLFVPTQGFMTAINAVTGAVLSTTALGTPLVREVDARFVLGDTRCYLPASGALWVFDGTPPGAGGIGASLPGSPLPLASPLIEGNDMEVDPTGVYGYLPTLASMYQVDLGAAALGFAAVMDFPGYTVQQRNHDVVFTPVGVLPPRAVYCVQGMTFIYTVVALPPPPIAVPTPGILVDGVDPAFTDSPPFGTIFTVSTLGFTHVVNAVTGLALPFSPIPTPGVLRTDVDSKPGPMPGNKVLQPTIGALVELSGFAPNDWVVTTAGGVWVVSMIGAPSQFVPTPMPYRGGDAQPLTLLGPPEPAFSVDDPDQDFLTKCWEYKYALNRSPYWWSITSPAYYPHWVPFGVFGPPALVGYDVLNRYKLLILDNQSIDILNENGNLIQNLPMPQPIMGGLIWDWDNKICKIRLHNQVEAIINLATIPNTGLAGLSFTNYGSRVRWYPVVDRMNGWEYVVFHGGRRVWVFDHFQKVFVTTIALPSDCFRPPVFDDQRKVLCLPLANYQVGWINGFRLRVGLPNAIYYTPSLGAHIVGAPVFDLYNHFTIFKLQGGRIAIASVDDGTIRWDSGLLGRWPIGPIQVDCYNQVAKCFFRDAANYYEMVLNMYPMATGGVPALQWHPLPAPTAPYGYPVFYSQNGYEFIRRNFNTIRYNSLWGPFAPFDIVTPQPMVGKLFIDRVNGYGLVRIQGGGGVGTGRLFWLDLFRVTQGMPGATKVIPLVDHFLALDDPVEDIVFDTQGHTAAVHLAGGQVALIDMRTGTQLHATFGMPPLLRQLYVHPFSHLVNYPAVGGDVVINMAGLGTGGGWSAMLTATTLGAGITEATDFLPPPLLIPPAQLPHEGGNNVGMVQFEFPLGSLEPGSILQVTNQTTFETDRMDDPNEAVAESDGSAEVSVIAEAGDNICFVAFDPAGNASPPLYLLVNPVVGVPDEAAPTAFAFALVGSNPARDLARFRFALPTRTRVEVGVFDVAGRRIATPVNAEMDAGEHEALWTLHTGDGRLAANGIYLVRFKTAGHESVHRLVVAH